MFFCESLILKFEFSEPLWIFCSALSSQVLKIWNTIPIITPIQFDLYLLLQSYRVITHSNTHTVLTFNSSPWSLEQSTQFENFAFKKIALGTRYPMVLEAALPYY